MKPTLIKFTIGATWALLAALVTGAAPADDTTTGLSILLTNDDGYEAAGLTALETALRAAGHRVTVVAPLGQRSGSGMKITLGNLGLRQHRAGLWSVDGSPADAVSIGLSHVMQDAPPDLVVAGANFGQNLGANTMMSGTVGGAMMAVLAGIPAIAVSVGIRLDEMGAKPVRFPSTVAAFPGAATVTTSIVARLAGGSLDALREAGAMLNVNYPLGADANEPPVACPVSRFGAFRLVYPEQGEGTVRSWIAADPRATADAGRDTALFAAGRVTVSVLRPDWNAGAGAPGAQSLLGDLVTTATP